MAGLARTFASIQSSLSSDGSRECAACHTVDYTVCRDRLPPSASFSDFSLHVGDDVARLYDSRHDDLDNSFSKESFSTCARPSSFAGDGNTVRNVFNAGSQGSAAPDGCLMHTHSMPARRTFPGEYLVRGGAFARSSSFRAALTGSGSVDGSSLLSSGDLDAADCSPGKSVTASAPSLLQQVGVSASSAAVARSHQKKRDDVFDLLLINSGGP